MQLTIPLTEFSEKLNQFIDEGSSISVTMTSVKNDEDLQTLRQTLKGWRDNCDKFLKESFFGENSNDFATSFHNSGANVMHFPRPEISQKVTAIKQSLTGNIDILKYFIIALQYSDAITDPQKIINEKRDKWTIEQKKLFIL